MIRPGLLLLSMLLVAAALLALGTPAEAQVRPHACNYCHNLHGSTGTLPLTDHSLDVDLCMSCHDDAAPPTYDGKTVPKGVAVHAGSKHTGGDETTCKDCHDHFGEAGSNLKLIPETLDSPYTGLKPVVFTARTGPNSFADGDATIDGVCEVCHTATNYQLANGSNNAHNAQADCTTCHGHDTGFAPPTGGGCSMCHDSAQGSLPRRPIFPELAYTSHHIDWAAAGYASELDIPEYQCQFCHDQSNHQSQTVWLNDVDAFEITEVTATAAAGLDGTYFLLRTPTPESVAVWFDVDDNGTAEPAHGATRSVKVSTVTAAMTATDVAAEVATAVLADADFVAYAAGSVVTIKSATQGSVADATAGTAGFAVLVLNQGAAGAGPFNPAVAADVQQFCLGCHGNNGGVGAGGIAPFVDGVVPPAVDETAWNASAHATNYACLDCHESGHGSQKTRLLGRDPSLTGDPNSGNDVAAAAPALAEQEEGFCFYCHNPTGDGNAAPDMQTRYALPINWVDLATGVLSNANFNDRHDVQYDAQAVSGAKVECADCHDPHAATAGQPWKSDPDPGRTPLTVGVSAQSLFCLDCHDNTFPASVTPPTNALVDVDNAWTNIDGMGHNTGGPQLSTQTGAWPANVTLDCEVCHNPHPVATYAGAFDTTNLFGLLAPVFGPGGEPLEGWSDVAGDWTLTDYSFSTNANSKQSPTPDADNGGVWCNSCHARDGMIGKSNCTGCHAHSDGRF